MAKRRKIKTMLSRVSEDSLETIESDVIDDLRSQRQPRLTEGSAGWNYTPLMVDSETT